MIRAGLLALGGARRRAGAGAGGGRSDPRRRARRASRAWCWRSTRRPSGRSRAARGRATIRFPGKALEFSTARHVRPAAEVAHPGDRGTERPRRGPRGRRARLRLPGHTTFVAPRFLALDIADRDAGPPTAEAVEAEVAAVAASAAPVQGPAPEDAAARDAREASAMKSAEELLIEQIERAASQGLVELSEPAAPPPAPEPAPAGAEIEAPGAEHPAQPAAPAASGPPDLPLRAEAPAGSAAGTLAALLEHEQIEATTVFDRDGRRRATAAGPWPRPSLPSGRGARRRRLVERPAAGRAGGGALATGSSANSTRRTRARCATLARLLHPLRLRRRGRAPARELRCAAAGPGAAARPRPRHRGRRGRAGRAARARAAVCPGRHGLWLALGGAAPVFHDAEHFADGSGGLRRAAARSAPACSGRALIGRLLDAAATGEARLIYETAARPGIEAGVEMRLAEARLVAAEGAPGRGGARARRAGRVERAQRRGGVVAPGAGSRSTRSRRSRSGRSPTCAPRRCSTAAPELEARAAAAARRGARRAGRAARRRSPRSAPPRATCPRMCPSSTRWRCGCSRRRTRPRWARRAYAETVLATADLIAPIPASRPGAARHRCAAGRARPAERRRSCCSPRPPPAATAAARLIAADAELRLGRGAAARAALGGARTGRGGRAARRGVRARRRFRPRGGAARPRDRPRRAYAWPAGDWPRARRRGATLPTARRWRAAWRRGPAAASPRPPRRIRRRWRPRRRSASRCPSLVDPSLDAARRLLATGTQVEGFVEGLLAEP